MNTLTKNPYRLFFAVGLLGLIIGLSVWIISGLFDHLYFGRLHAHYMIGVFLLNFIIGFLFTAIPRMTGTAVASQTEIALQFIAVLNTGFWGFFESDESYFFLSILLSLMLLFIFCFKRLRLRSQTLPDIFPLVMISLGSGMSGAALFLAGQEVLGGRLFYLNLVLCLCVGIGARLIPNLLRLKNTPKYPQLEFWMIGSILTGACLVEVLWSEASGNLIRSLSMMLVAIRYWRIHLFNSSNSSVGWGIRIAALSMLAGNFGMWLFPDYRLESLHILYISGFGLLTLMVATRVILSHGSHDLNLEFKNWYIRVPVGLIILSMATRVSAVFIQSGYERHLAYAAFTFLLGCLFWAIYFFPKLLNLSRSKL